VSALARSLGLAWMSAAILGAAALSGCTTDAFCFDECTTGSSSAASSSSGSGLGGFLNTGGAGGDCFPGCGTTGAGCVPTNSGVEICDGVDNDCDGKIDNVDLTSAKSCGSCDNNCFTRLLNNDPLSIKCEAGACVGACSLDYLDLDGDGACEYYCVKTSSTDATCNHKDDDCNGVQDDGVDVCADAANCGKCGNNCVVLHGTATCVHSGAGACDSSNTQCQVAACSCNGPGDCWWDLDGISASGCEYQCDLTNGGVEICDGIDNDCDGKIDNADDVSGDPRLGVTCFGGLLGECAAAMHAGTSACLGGQVVCDGAAVLVPDLQQETCNGKDDDCDGVVDDNPTNVGGSCGASNNFPCTFGVYQCQGGALVCLGAVDPGVETCNGQDDDCDGVIDSAGGLPPADSAGPCNAPIPPPAGAVSACSAGAKACQGGSIVCSGAVGPSSASDGCNIDANCDGLLTNQPATATDVHNCGACGNDCLAGAVHSDWSCVAGACAFQGCQAGYYDLTAPADNTCEYACVFVSATESCNGVDDNCNGQIDEGVIAPSPAQVCGVSPSATASECAAGSVQVTCQAGLWKCGFNNPAVCNPTCAAATEVCDTLDNNCNGATDENIFNIGDPCASDVGKPAPGDGVCRTFGTLVCNGPSASKCSAVKDSSKAGPELCDGQDNDCDGLVDEPFTGKGSNAAFFVKPAVTKVQSASGAPLWIHTYEASRPSATNLTAGTGNGFFTSAPAGVPLDRTPACSSPSKIPWFDVSGPEVEDVCAAAGGHICDPTEWRTACHAKSQTCVWGYGPSGAACTSGFLAKPPNNPGKFCNLANSYDFNPLALGDQDGVLPTGSPLLSQCFADWTGVLGNQAPNDKVYDITGNLREITRIAGGVYNLLGGAFDSQDETGASCDFTFYSVDGAFKFYDTGFRCCFSADPTL
jgi:hypothetical protein